jgi:hypothetical protein
MAFVHQVVIHRAKRQLSCWPAGGVLASRSGAVGSQDADMRPYHVVAAFAVYCAVMLIAGTVGWRQFYNAATLPHVYAAPSGVERSYTIMERVK